MENLDSSDWKPWFGGEIPVPLRTLVDVKTRGGDFGTKLFAGTREYLPDSEGGATAEDWSHTNVRGDIIAYRVRIVRGTEKGMSILRDLLNKQSQPARVEA